jgi:G3E family GTPase
MRKPLIIVTGVDPTAMESVMTSLVWDVPKVVSIRHTIDPVRQALIRMVSCIDGSLDTTQVDLEHACVSCAIREDILPTILRYAKDTAWEAIIACFPVSAEADHVSSIIARDPAIARHVRLASVIAAVPSTDVAQYILSHQSLEEHGLHTGPDDSRSIGEVSCGQIEYADSIISSDRMIDGDRALVHALMRPNSSFVMGVENVNVSQLLGGRHMSSHAYAWRSPRSDFNLPELGGRGAWRIDLKSPRPFHPERLLDHIALMDGPFRSRGCFWVPTRPEAANSWDGVAGQLSLGPHSWWHPHPPLTRLILTGVGDPPDHLRQVFSDLVLSASEMDLDASTWMQAEDGLEPWLGDIHRAA